MNNKKRLFKRPSLLSFVFLFFIISTSFLVIGYSANSSTLAIDGSLVTRSNLDVRITDIKLNSSGLQLASQTVTPGYTAKSIDGGVRLTSASSYVTYDVTVTNLSSQNVLVTDIASTQWTNTNMEYVLENLTINETIILAASEYTFQVKIKFKDSVISKISGFLETVIENVLGISLNLNMVLDFTFYKVPQYSLEITSNPEDAIITYTVYDEVVATCTGYCRKVFDVNTKVTWKVQKEGLTAKTNTVTMDKNYSETVDISSFTGKITYSTMSISCANYTKGSSPYAIKYTGNCSVHDDGNDNWKIKFLTSGSLTLSTTTNVDAFLVGGGGGGGGKWGGGGGGGYTKTYTNLSLQSNTAYEVTIGAGGSGGSYGSNGESSSLTIGSKTYSAAGGSGGGLGNTSAGCASGGSGGSGGGGGGLWAGKAGTNGSNGGDSGYVNSASQEKYCSGGSGQGTTTGEFGSSSGTLFASGGAGSAGGTGSSGEANTGDGGGGGTTGANGMPGGSGVIIIRNKRYKFTLVPDPQSAAVNLKCGGTEVNGFGTQSCDVDKNTTIEYSVTKAGYYDKSGSYTIETSDYTLNVTLEEKPWITGTYVNTSSTLAATESLTVYHSGKYLIDIWGGKGADKFSVDLTSSGYGGAAGHVYGVVELYEGQTVYYTLGGNAQTSVLGGLFGGNILISESGVNGGGKAKSDSLGAGGGYSAFALDTAIISESTINSGNVLFIAAGGGGGGGSDSSKKDTFACGDGGAGGNMSSTKTAVSTIGYAFSGENGTVPSDGDSTYIGGGGSSTAGVCSSRSNNNGSLLSGGESYEKGGAGGAGYYGGAGGRGTGKDKSGKYSAGGGGGSSFISSLATFEGLDSSVTSKVSTSNPSTTGGSLIITYIGS